MYNTEQKTRFIKEFTDSVSVREIALNVFKISQSFEEKAGKDIAAMDTDEVQEVFDSVAGVRDRSRYGPQYILREYARWSVRNGVPGATGAAEKISSAGIDRLRSEMVRNPRQLQIFLDALYIPESEETAENGNRAFCWLAYSGISSEETLKVMASELDFSRMVITHGGNEYPIYTESLPAFRNCATLTHYRYFHPNYTFDDAIYRERKGNGELLRGFRGLPALSAFRVDLSKRNTEALKEGKTTLRLTYDKIWLSGVFYRMYQDELAGIPVNFDDFTWKLHGNTEYKLDRTKKTKRDKLKEISRGYLTDYERWKQTLN